MAIFEIALFSEMSGEEMGTAVAQQKNLMAGTWTKAATIRRAFKAGKKRQKDYLLEPRRAVLEAYGVLHDLRAAMLASGLAEADAHAILVFFNAEAGQISILPLPEPERMPELYGKARALETQGGWGSLGILLQQKDREVSDAQLGIYMWAQQWLMDDVSARALLFARDCVAKGLVKNGGGEHTLS